MFKHFVYLLLYCGVVDSNLDETYDIESIENILKEETQPSRPAYAKCMAYVEHFLDVIDIESNVVVQHVHIFMPGVIIFGNIILSNYAPDVQYVFNGTRYDNETVSVRYLAFATGGGSKIEERSSETNNREVRLSINMNQLDFDDEQKHSASVLPRNYYDVQLALIILKHSFQLDENTVVPLPLPEHDFNTTYKNCGHCVVLGWGNNITLDSFLFQVKVQVLLHEVCQELLPQHHQPHCFVPNNKNLNICKLFHGGEPLICQSSVTGIVKALDCKLRVVPFVDVHSNSEWIYSIINTYGRSKYREKNYHDKATKFELLGELYVLTFIIVLMIGSKIKF